MRSVGSGRFGTWSEKVIESVEGHVVWALREDGFEVVRYARTCDADWVKEGWRNPVRFVGEMLSADDE